jgi:hypothetical protein
LSEGRTYECPRCGEQDVGMMGHGCSGDPCGDSVTLGVPGRIIPCSMLRGHRGPHQGDQLALDGRKIELRWWAKEAKSVAQV